MEVELGGLRMATWPVGALILLVVLVILWRKEHSLSYLVCVAIFGLYLLFALDKAFFPIAISGAYADFMREGQFSLSVNLIPFNFNLSEIPDIVLLQIFQNVLLTIPFGFGLSFVAPIRSKDLLWLIPAVGLGIETTQLMIALLLRYPYRVIDVNDALLNALGVLIGYGIFSAFAWSYLWVAQRFPVKQSGLAAYVAAIASRAHTRAW